MDDQPTSSSAPEEPPNLPPRRTRARSNSIRGENPLEIPITAADHRLSKLGALINAENARSRRQSVSQVSRAAFQQTVEEVVSASREEEERLRRERRARLFTSGGYTGDSLQSRSDEYSSSGGFLAPRPDPIDRSKTPTQDDYQSPPRPAIDLLSGNRAFRATSQSGPSFASLIGPPSRPSPESSGGNSFVASSERSYQFPPGSRVQLELQRHPFGPRPPIPVVEQHTRQPGRPSPFHPNQQSPGSGSSNGVSRPTYQSNQGRDFPVRNLPVPIKNPARRTPQISVPIGLHPGQTAVVALWDPNVENYSSAGSEAFPSFENDSGFEEENSQQTREPFPPIEEEGVEDQVITTTSEEDQLSPIGKLIAANRIRSSSNSSGGTVVTAVLVTSSVPVIPEPTSTDSSSSEAFKPTDVPDNLTDLVVNIVRIPDETYEFLDKLVHDQSFIVPKHLTDLQTFSAQLPDEQIELLKEIFNPTLEDLPCTDTALDSNEGLQLRPGTQSRNEHRGRTKTPSCSKTEYPDSQLLQEFLNPSLEDYPISQRIKGSSRSTLLDSSASIEERLTQSFIEYPPLENKYYNQGLSPLRQRSSSSGSPRSSRIKIRSNSRDPEDSSPRRLQLKSQPTQNHTVQSSPQHGERPRSLPIIQDYRGVAYLDKTPKLDSYSEILRKMSFQGYADQSAGGAGSNPRQAPPSPSQGAQHSNGMNGGMGMGGGMVGYPTPAGHQSDLNYLMGMVEELSGVLALNQRLTNGVVEKMGRVREKAQNMNLSNDELLQIAAAELNDGSQNLERENSELRAALEKSEYDKKENFKLACHGANILADITEKMHAFKEQHEADTLAWHKNYRKQLAEEREENLRLRNQINDMIAAAARANGHLRDMRRYLADHDELHELRVQNVKYRQERRMWKRMALPMIPDDDSEWSDDDDLIDPEEKKRLAALAEKKAKEEAECGEGEGSSA